MEKCLIDIIEEQIQSIKEFFSYAKKDFPTERHEDIYMSLRKSYLVSLWLILTIGFTGLHCFYINSCFFLFYLIFYMNHILGSDVIQSVLYISIFELIRVPIAIYIANLKLKKAIIDNLNEVTFMYNNLSKYNVIYIVITIVMMDIFFIHRSFDIFHLWKIFLNLHN